MPFALVIAIVINPDWGAEGCAAIGAAHKHDFGEVVARREHAGKHVNVVISRTVRTVHGHECLSGQSYSIYSAAAQVATHVDRSDLIEGRRLASILRIARTKAIKLVRFSGHKQLTVGVHIEGSPLRRVGKIQRCLPSNPTAIGGPAEVSAVARKEPRPELVLEPMTHTADILVDRKPFLVTSMGRPALRPALASIRRRPYVITEERLILVRLKTEIEKFSRFIAVCHGIAAKNIIFQDTGERPVYAAIGSITPTRLPEVGVNTIELPPGDHHLVRICRVNRDRRLIGGVAEDVVAAGIHVCLVTGEHAELRDHARRSLHSFRRRGRVVVFFQWFIERLPAYG
jgi:hypothetical protein